ncbi:MAG: transporter permease [Planctomycetaceae bacterium]|nr:transporter permease [Planctomycetaceae bacterium]
MSGFFTKEAIYAPPGFNRWRVPPASIAIHLCIGSLYSWSSFNTPLTRVLGVVTPAADDWILSSVVAIFTVAIVCCGLTAAVAGSWLEKVGPRTVGLLAAVGWGGGFILGGLGILFHQLWLLYLGYGFIGGCGLGLGYVSPVSTLIRWFPDRRGLATGMAIMGFGGGAIIGAPLQEELVRRFYQAPQYLGTTADVPLTTNGGRRYAEVSGKSTEVVVVSDKDVSQMIVRGKPGVYVVGTGSTGVAAAFFTLGGLYFVVMVLAALSFRVPAPGWQPAGWTPPDPQLAARKMVSHSHVELNTAMCTPQFYLLWIVLCFNVTAGIGVLGVAKTIMTDLFSAALPQLVTSDFAKMYVVMISIFNLMGRFFWASASDYIGRKTTYAIFLILGTLLYASIPMIAQQMSVSPSVVWLVVFYAVTMIIFTMYGGGFATIPAYLADMFGTRFVGAIHGRLLTAWSAAGVLGPMVLAALRERTLQQTLKDLTSRADPAAFLQKFGAPTSDLSQLIQSKTVTISKLLEVCPPGTSDPSSTLYNTTMYFMAGLLATAAVANACIHPVHERHAAKD